MRIRVKFWIFLIAIIYATIELICFAGLVVLEKTKGIHYEPLNAFELYDFQKEKIKELLEGQNKYLAFDARLGWTIMPNGNVGQYQSNSQGLRANRDYSSEMSAGKKRILTFGDSYTHGDEVNNNETWQAYMEKIDPALEVINFGVPGYGLDQAYLRYEEVGNMFEVDIVLIGLFSENIFRHVNTFRPFYTPMSNIPLTKPRLLLFEGQVIEVENPIQSIDEYRRLLTKDKAFLAQIGKHDFYYKTRYRKSVWDFLPSVRMIKIGMMFNEHIKGNSILLNSGEKTSYYNPRSEAFLTTLAIMEMFANKVKAAGNIPIVVFFPTSSDILQYKRYGTNRYEALKVILDKIGLNYIDVLSEVFKNTDGNLKKYFLNYHHWPI